MRTISSNSPDYRSSSNKPEEGRIPITQQDMQTHALEEMGSVFKAALTPTISIVQEYYKYGYNQDKPQCAPSLDTALKDEVDKLDKVLKQHGHNLNPDKRNAFFQIFQNLRYQVDGFDPKQVSFWIDDHIPIRQVTGPWPFERSLGVQREVEPHQDMGSRKTAQSLVRRLEASLQIMVQVARSISSLVMNYDTTLVNQHVDSELIAELTYDLQLESANLDNMETSKRGGADTINHLKERSEWAQLRTARSQQFIEKSMTDQRATCRAIKKEIDKLHSKLGENGYFSKTSAFKKGEAHNYLQKTKKLLIETLPHLSTESVTTENMINDCVSEGVRSNEKKKPLKTKNEQPMSKNSVGSILQKKLRSAKEETALLKDKLTVVTKRAKSVGIVGLRTIDENHQPKSEQHHLSDSMVRSMLWQLQQHTLEVLQAAQPLLVTATALSEMDELLLHSTSYLSELSQDADPTAHLKRKLTLESPEMKERSKHISLNALVQTNITDVEKCCDRSKRETTVPELKKQAEKALEILALTELSVPLDDQRRCVIRCQRLLHESLGSDLNLLSSDLGEATDLLRQAIVAANRTSRNWNEVKALTEKSVVKVTLAKTRLSERSAKETGRDLGDTSRGAQLAKFWAMKLAEGVAEHHVLPNTQQTLSLLHNNNLADSVASVGDPKGLLLATRLSTELGRAKEGTLLPSMTPDQYADYEKNWVEFMVAWGQRRFTRGVTEHAFELVFSVPMSITFNVFSPLFRLPLASLQLPFQIHKTKVLVGPGQDKPYKAIDTMLKKRMQQLGWHMVTSPLPTVAKTVVGALTASTGYVYNHQKGNKERTLGATTERLIQGKKSHKLRIGDIKSLAIHSLSAGPHSILEGLSEQLQIPHRGVTNEYSTTVRPEEGIDESKFVPLVNTVLEAETKDIDESPLNRGKRAVEAESGPRNHDLASDLSPVEKYYSKFDGDILQFREKSYNKLRNIPIGEEQVTFLRKRLKKSQRLLSRSPEGDHKRFLELVVSTLRQAAHADNELDRQKAFQPMLSQVDAVLYESLVGRFESAPNYAQIPMLIDYQKSLWSAYLAMDSVSFTGYLQLCLQETEPLTNRQSIRSDSLSSQEALNYHKSSLLEHLQVEEERDLAFESQVKKLMAKLKSNQMIDSKPESSESCQAALDRAEEEKWTSSNLLDRVMYNLCKQALLVERDQAQLQESFEQITTTLLTDPRFDNYKVSLLPSERMFVERHLSLSSETLIDEILAYRTGIKPSLHINTDDIEYNYLRSLEDRWLPDGRLLTRQAQIDDILHHGGLVAYEHAILRSNRMLQAMHKIELPTLSHQFWQEQGVSQPDKISYVYSYPYLPAADLYTMPNENSARSEQIEKIEHIKRFEPSYNRVIESKMGPKYLHAVNRDELRLEAINWDVDKYHQYIKHRLTRLLAAQTEESKTYLDRVLPNALTPPRYTTSTTMTPYFIRPSIHGLPLENMLILKDDNKYTVISLLPPSGRIETLTGRDELEALFVAPENHEWVLSHASLYNQMDGRECYGMESALEAIRGGERASDWKFMPEVSANRLVEPGVLRTIAHSSMGNQGTGHYLRTNLIEATSRSYWEGISGAHSIELGGDYSLPDEFNQPDGQASFDKLYTIQKSVDMQRLAERAIKQFQSEHFEVYSDHLKANFNRLVEKAWHSHENHPWRSSLLLNKMRFEPNNVDASIPGLVGKQGQHLPLEGMIIFRDPDPSKAQYVLVSLLGDGALVEFDDIEKVHRFFANPGNRHFLLSHMSEDNKQPVLLGVSTPADTLSVLEKQSKQYPLQKPVGISRAWTSTENTFDAQHDKMEVNAANLVGATIGIVTTLGVSEATKITTNALKLEGFPLSQDWNVNMFDTLARRNFQRLESDADTLFKSHSEWRTEKALEITSAVLAVPAAVLSLGAIAATGGAAALPLAAAALAVDSISFAVSLAEGVYLISQADSAEERAMGFVPLALAPLDMLGVASSVSDVLKTLKALKAPRAAVQISDTLSDILPNASHTVNQLQEGGGDLSASLMQRTDLSVMHKAGSLTEAITAISQEIDEQLTQIQRGIEELQDLERELKNLPQNYPARTSPMANLTDFTLDEHLQVSVQRLSAPKLTRGRWGGVLVDEGRAVPGVRSSRGEYLFSDTPTGAKSIGISADNEAILMRYLDTYTTRQMNSDIDELPEIYARIGPRPGAARLKGLFPVEDATKGVINGLTNFSVRTGGIPGPSLIARYKKIVGWEKSLSGGGGHGVMLEISPYPGSGMIKVGDGKVSFGDIAAALRHHSQDTHPKVAGHTSEIGLEGRSMNWNRSPIRRPIINGERWTGLPGILPGSDDDLRLYLELGGNPEEYLATLKEIKPDVSTKGFTDSNKRLRGKVENGRFWVKESHKEALWAEGTWQQEVAWRFKYRKGLVDTTEELDKRIQRASQNDASYGNKSTVVAFNDAKQAGAIEPKVARWLQDFAQDMDSQGYLHAFGLSETPVKRTLESSDLRQSGFLHLRGDRGSKRFEHVVYVHVASDGTHLYQINQPQLQQILGRGVTLRQLKEAEPQLHTKHQLDKQSMVAFNDYLRSNEQKYVFTTVDDVHRSYTSSHSKITENSDEFEVTISDQHPERMQLLSSRAVGRLMLGGDTAHTFPDPLVQYSDRFKGQVNVEAVSIHADAQGRFYYKDQSDLNTDRTAHTPAEFVQYLRNQGIDLSQGRAPVHLLACYAKSSGAAQNLADEIGRPIIAYSNRRLQIDTPALENPRLSLTSDANKLRQILKKEDFKPASERVFYPTHSSDEMMNSQRSKASLPLRRNALLGNKTQETISSGSVEEKAIEKAKVDLHSIYERYQNEPLEKCENAARDMIETLKLDSSYSDVRLGNMAFWEGAHGRLADSYMNHWVVIAKLKGVELVMDPTAHQFKNKLGIEDPVLDTYDNWVAAYQSPLSQKRMMLVKLVEVPQFSKAPFKSNDEFSGFRYIKEAKVLSSSRWYHQSGYDQYIGSLQGNVRKTFFEAEPSTAFVQGTLEGGNSVLDGGNERIKYFFHYKQGKIQNGVFLVSSDAGVTWEKGSWKEENAYRFNSRDAPLELPQLDKRIDNASVRDRSYSRICYTGAFNDAEQAGVISPQITQQLHRVIAKRDEAGEIMSSQHYQSVFELKGESYVRFERNVFKNSGFLHVGERGVDGSINYDHVVYVHVNENGVCFYQVNGSDFQFALGESDEIGTHVSPSHGKHMMNDDRVDAFNQYFIDNPDGVFAFTTAKRVTQNVKHRQALSAMLQEGLIDYDTYRSSVPLTEGTEQKSGFMPNTSKAGTKYVYFPSLNREHIHSRLIPLLRCLKVSGSAPFEIVFKTQEQVQDFQRILTESYGAKMNSTLEPELQYLYSVGKTHLQDLRELDTLHINGLAYFDELESKRRDNAVLLAQELTLMGLPVKVALKVINKAPAPDYFLEPFAQPIEGEFQRSFAGQLEDALVALQPERALGKVSGNSGLVHYQLVDSVTVSVTGEGTEKTLYTRGNKSPYYKAQGRISDFRATGIERHIVFDPLLPLRREQVGTTKLHMEFPVAPSDGYFEPIANSFRNGQGRIILSRDKSGEHSSRKVYIVHNSNVDTFELAYTLVWQRASKGEEPIDILLLEPSVDLDLIDIMATLSRSDRYDEVFFYTGEPPSDLVEVIKRPNTSTEESEQILELIVSSLNKKWAAHALSDDPFYDS